MPRSSPSPRRRKVRPTSVADVVSALVFDKVEGRPATQRGRLTLRVFRAFDQLGPPITSHAEASSFRGGALFLIVDDPTWLTELSFLKTEILDRLEKLLAQAVVKEIRLRLGTISSRRRRNAKAELPPISPQAAEQIRQWATMIREPGVREAMERAARWAIAVKRKK